MYGSDAALRLQAASLARIVYLKQREHRVLTEEQKSEIQQAVASYLASHTVGRFAMEPGTSGMEPLVRVVARAVEVFGTSEKALRWLNSSVRGLDDRTPASLLGTAEGITMVEDALGRIEHGVW